ncbi:MAG TPA: 3-deoxy-D-manno-octulosonic acid transferase [Fimbriimonadaceae bacterium]|nr:3-deoxy-D-manno-octulosonic acid transferase [Fimbriimonadaceae bacterium]
MVFLLYNFLLTIFSPFWVPWMLWRAAQRKEKPNWKERQGFFQLTPNKSATRVWVHAVSVGEVVAAAPILRELKAQKPDLEIVLSVTTSSGHQTARETVSDAYDHLVYMPIDIPMLQLRAMQRVQPKVVAIMETELWMDFLWAAKTFEARTLLINGRISDRSFPWAKLLKFFYHALLKNMDRCLMQTSVDAERIKALGAQDVEVLGNCKFDQAVEGLDADPQEWREKLGVPRGADQIDQASRPPFTIVIGSTRGSEEEDFVLNSLSRLDGLFVIHAPRHMERVSDLAAKVKAKFGKVSLRSEGPATSNYLILDTYGELSSVYSVADVVIIGGGFANHGGQNLIQPLAHGKPVLHGPHMQNFRAVAESAQKAGASQVCRTPEDLAAAMKMLREDESTRSQAGAAAKTLVQENLGASKRYADAILKELD